MPVDASYGLAADAFQPAAVDALAASKGRGRDLPIPVMVGSWSGLDGLTLMVQPSVRALVEAFWPGALTLVIEHAPSLAWDLGDSRGNVSIRMPLHPVALELLARTGPLAVSGANLTGKRVPLTAADAQEQLGYAVAVYLDGGHVHRPGAVHDRGRQRHGAEAAAARARSACPSSRRSSRSWSS